MAHAPPSAPSTREEGDDGTSVQAAEAHDDRVAQLTEAVATITAERTSMAALFAADKKAAAEAHRTALGTLKAEVGLPGV